MGCQQCLPLSVVQLKGKHCRRPIAVMGVANAFQHWTTCSHIDKSVRIRRMKLIRRGIRQRTVSMSMSIVIVIAVEGNQYVAGDWRAAGRPGRAAGRYGSICIFA